MNITFDRFPTDDSMYISFGKYYMNITMPKHEYYRCTFINTTNIPEEILRKIFGDIRVSTCGHFYMPYWLYRFQITDDFIRVIGYGTTMRHDIVTIIKWKKAA